MRTYTEQQNGLKPYIAPQKMLSEEVSVLPLGRVTVKDSGAKAFGAKRLEELSHHDGATFRTPKSLVIPFGVMEASLQVQPTLAEEYHRRLRCLERLRPEELSRSLAELRAHIRKLEIPGRITSEVLGHFGPGARLMVRSSSNCEDLEELAGAGLYESAANVSADRAADAVRDVWASLWTKRAVIARQNSGIPHNLVFMGVLIQEMLTPDLSFILHTVNPANHNRHEILVELVSGLGETLAAAERPGTPYRMVCNKQSGDVSMLAFANFSQAILPDAEGGIVRKTLDYSKIGASVDESYRQSLGNRLAAIGLFVETALGSPQDIEGIIAGEAIYLVQSRPQQGI